MMTRPLLTALACLATVPALGQTPAPPKDAKDYQIEMMAAQRNEMSDRLAICYSQNSVMVMQLRQQLAKAAEDAETERKARAAENTKMVAELAAAKKATCPAPPPVKDPPK